MNQDQIIELAQVAGASKEQAHVYVLMTDELLKFARLIAEDCAKRCDAVGNAYDDIGSLETRHAADSCAKAIREAYKL